MANPDGPVKMPELYLIPESERGIELDKGMKQVLSILTAYYGEKRVTLKASKGGILCTTSPHIVDIIVALSDDTNYLYQGDNIACSEVMVMGHPSNGNSIWVRPHKIATLNNAWPLLKKEVVNFSIGNLSMLHILIPVNTERAIIAYTI